MAIGDSAKLAIQPGKNSEFEGIFAELQAAVANNEPGNNFYALHKYFIIKPLFIILLILIQLWLLWEICLL